MLLLTFYSHAGLFAMQNYWKTGLIFLLGETMKKRKKTPENPNITVSGRKSAKLRSYRERLEKESLEWERKRNALFRRRVNSASEKKAPLTQRSKAYYRFSKNYPSVVSPDGFRENINEKEKMTTSAKIALSVFCVLVFVASFIAIRTGVALSLYEEETTAPDSAITEEAGINAYFLSYKDLVNKTAEQLVQELSAKEFNSAVIEFKSEYGYVYFDVGSFIGASADRKISTAYDKVTALKAAGIECIAYISCFKDSVAASSISGMEVLTSSGAVFRDSQENMWLDPYSSAAHDYITGLAVKALEGGFDRVMLDNVCFPVDFYLSAPVYLSREEEQSKNDALTQFIATVCEAAGKDNVILCGDITAFAEISALPDEKYGGILTDTACSSFCLDLRSDSQYSVQLENSDKFRYVEEMPLAFILDAATLATAELGNKKDAYFFCAMIDAQERDAVRYVKYTGTENIISDFPD